MFELFHVMDVGVDRATLSQHKSRFYARFTPERSYEGRLNPDGANRLPGERLDGLIGWSLTSWLPLKCCFTSTETVGLLGTGAQDVHLDFHTAPEFCH